MSTIPAPGRIRLHPLCQRCHQHGVRTTDLHRRAPGGAPGPPGRLRQPRRVGFVQCVGSRSRNPRQSLLLQHLLHEHHQAAQYLKDNYPDTEVTVYYMDLRAFGKGFEELLMRSGAAGCVTSGDFRGRCVEDPATGDLTVTVENTTANRLEKHDVDMLVLAVGAVPAATTEIGPSDGQPVEIAGRISQGGPRQAAAGGYAHQGGFHRRGRRKPQGCPRKRHPGQCGRRAGRHFAQQAAICRGGGHRCGGCRPLQDVRPMRSGVSLRGDHLAEKTIARVISAACAGCGTCAAECQFGAIQMRHFSDQAIYAQIDAILDDDPQDKILTFACNWCSYAGADTAGVGRMAYPPNARIIRTMCSGRVDPEFVWYAFRKGAPVVLVSGCHYVDCHYIDANRSTVRRVDGLWDGLEKAGVRPERLLLEWCSGGRRRPLADDHA